MSLRDKLVEEAEEFAATPTAEELADVLEVVHALATATSTSPDEVEALRRAKAAERGAFRERLLLESVSYPDQPPEDSQATPAELINVRRVPLGAAAAIFDDDGRILLVQSGKEPPTGNPWQNVDRLRSQWLADFDRDPLDGLDAETVQTLRLAFSRRHLLEHNRGVIDERYRHETGEGSIGRRIRIAPAFVDQVHDAVVSLAERLGATAR